MQPTPLQPDLPLIVDSDNALGSYFGDVDDGFALAALWRSSQPIEAVTSTYGNTAEARAFANHTALARLCGFQGAVLHGASAKHEVVSAGARYLAGLDHPVRVLALGPLTTLAQALRLRADLARVVSEVVFLGSNMQRHLPAWRLFDFNFSRDLSAVSSVFDSDLTLTCIPNDVARRLRMRSRDLVGLPGPLGDHLRRYSRRWFWRGRLLKWGDSVPVWDLVPSLYLIRPGLFEVRSQRVKLSRSGAVDFKAETGREMKVVLDFDAKRVWDSFVELVQ